VIKKTSAKKEEKTEKVEIGKYKATIMKTKTR
jgi:hypothetical protein